MLRRSLRQDQNAQARHKSTGLLDLDIRRPAGIDANWFVMFAF
jgi:hypothetical protein